MSARFVVVEIDRFGGETEDDVHWDNRDDADNECLTLIRVAQRIWPEIGLRYEVREVTA